MKKLYSEARWRERTKRRQARDKRQHPVRRALRRRRGPAVVVIPAPANFSLVGNPTEVLRFIELVEFHAAEERKTRLDFRNIQALTPDAIALLVAKSRQRYTYSTGIVRASKPKAAALRRIWNDSGLTDIFQSSEVEELPEPRGKIIMRSMVETNPDAAVFLRQFAEQHLQLEEESHWLSIQTILLECMANTVNHAEGMSREQNKPPSEPWYAAVYCDELSSSARFTFLDTGVGILESLRKKPPLREKLLMSTTSAPAVLAKVLDGAITSSTGLEHRGEGLPEIRTIAVFDQEIDRLVIVTNEVYADVTARQFRALPVRFHGTVLYWEKVGIWRKR